MKAFYTDEFVLPLPEGHRFPMQKYRLLRDKVAARIPQIALQVPRAASVRELARVHSPDYIEQVFMGTLPESIQKAIGFPWSEKMVERSIRSVGATLDALDYALQHGASVNLAGGTHHAMHNAGSGFCVFNDMAVGARHVSHIKPHAKVLILDLDVHQGDGTAALLGQDAEVFTCSLHGANNYPFSKQTSHLDIALADGTPDDAYLEALAQALKVIGQRFEPDVLMYLAGMDVHQQDRLGRLQVSDEGVAARDHMVLGWALERNLPVVMTMGGGYFPDLDHLTDLQCASIYRLYEYSHQVRLL